MSKIGIISSWTSETFTDKNEVKTSEIQSSTPDTKVETYEHIILEIPRVKPPQEYLDKEPYVELIHVEITNHDDQTKENRYVSYDRLNKLINDNISELISKGYYVTSSHTNIDDVGVSGSIHLRTLNNTASKPTGIGLMSGVDIMFHDIAILKEDIEASSKILVETKETFQFQVFHDGETVFHDVMDINQLDGFLACFNMFQESALSVSSKMLIEAKEIVISPTSSFGEFKLIITKKEG